MVVRIECGKKVLLTYTSGLTHFMFCDDVGQSVGQCICRTRLESAMFSIHRLCTYYSRHDEILWMASTTSPLLHSRLQSSRKSLMVLQPVLQPRRSPRSPHGPILSHGTLRRSQKTNSHVHDRRPLLTAVEYRCTTRPTERSEHIRRRPEALGGPDHQISRRTRRDVIYRHEHPPDDMRPVNQATVDADI